MGILNLIADAWKAVRRPPNDGERAYIGATIRTGEEHYGRYDTINPRDLVRVGHGITGSIFNAASLISRAAARGEMKLYRAGSGMGSKRISSARKSFLRSGALGISPSRKAMEYADDADDIEQVVDHPVIDIIRDPDPSLSSNDVMMLIYWYREICGHTYLWTGSGTPTGLYILHPQYTRPILSRTDGVTAYNYGRENSAPLRMPVEEVIVSKWMIDPYAPWQGTSWVGSIERYGDLEDAAVAAEVSRWKNSGQYGMVLKAPKEYTDSQIKQAEAALRARGGPLSAGRALVLRDVELIQSATKPHEMNYLPGLQQAEAAIYRAAGIPDPIWKMNDAIQSNAAEGGIQWQRAVYERQCRVADDLTEWLLPMFGIEPGEMWFAYDNPVTEDVDAKAARMRDAFVASAGRPVPVVDVNEYREAIGLEPRDDAEMEAEDTTTESVPTTDAATSVVAGAVAGAVAGGGADVAATALNGAQVQALADLATQVATGQLPLASARALATAAFPMVPASVLDAVFNPLASFTPEAPVETQTQAPQTSNADSGSQPGSGEPADGAASKSKGRGNVARGTGSKGARGRSGKAGAAELIPRWGVFAACGCKAADPTDDAIEKQMVRAIQAWAEDALKRGISAIGPDGSFDLSSLSASELTSLVNQAVTAAFESGAVTFASEHGIDAPPLTSQAAREYIKQYNFDLVKGVTQTMADQMRTTIDAGLEQGKTINEIQQELTDKVPEVSLARAETIARTETARAYQHGSLKQAEELGFDSKRWSLSGNPCGLCEGAAAASGAKKVTIGEPFFAAGETISGTDGRTYTMTRPVYAASDLHPNCSCSTIEYIDEGGQS